MNRRTFLTGLGALAMPAIIRTPGLLMPVRRIRTNGNWFGPIDEEWARIGFFVPPLNGELGALRWRDFQPSLGSLLASRTVRMSLERWQMIDTPVGTLTRKMPA